MRHQYHVIIIGGGFSGTALAIHLIRLADRPLRVTLIEERERLGRGVAYSKEVDEHVLNTRPDSMSLFSDSPELFKRWLESSATESASAQFVSRAQYCRYIEDTLIESLALHADGNVTFIARSQTRATAIERRARGFDVTLDDGTTLKGDAVVVATGHPAPSDPLARWLAPGTPRYLRDAWDARRLEQVEPTDRVLILGTALTMIDVVLALRRNGHRGSAHAMSRRGLLPRMHRAAPQELPPDLRESLRAAAESKNLLTVLRAVRSAIGAAAEQGIEWHAIFDTLRPLTPALWAGLSAEERKRFLRHLRPFWEVHRHRLAPDSARTIADLRQTGRLTIAAGRIRRAAATMGGIIVEREFRGLDWPWHDSFDWVINCTGPSFGGQCGSVLHDQLLASGLLTLDALGLGYETTADGLSTGANGRVEGLYLLGPACRPRDWEHTAVPELRTQAESLATELLAARNRRPWGRGQDAAWARAASASAAAASAGDWSASQVWRANPTPASLK
jgi:uncharacterized NAD(P)/FAD-binding protein YdhS